MIDFSGVTCEMSSLPKKLLGAENELKELLSVDGLMVNEGDEEYMLCMGESLI